MSFLAKGKFATQYSEQTWSKQKRKPTQPYQAGALYLARIRVTRLVGRRPESDLAKVIGDPLLGLGVDAEDLSGHESAAADGVALAPRAAVPVVSVALWRRLRDRALLHAVLELHTGVLLLGKKLRE